MVITYVCGACRDSGVVIGDVPCPFGCKPLPRWRQCYCGVIAVVSRAFPHEDCDGSVPYTPPGDAS